MAKRAEEFTEKGAQVVVVVTEEPFRVAAWKEKLGTDFLFLADPLSWASAQYGVAKQLLVHDEWVNVPSAFVVDGDGTLRYAHVGTAIDDRVTPDELIWAVNALGN